MVEKNKMISIILPNLNHRQFLKERIESIQNQTFEDWECIVIDGFSDDGSWDFFLETAKNDARFKIFQEPRKGVYDAWNKGIERAAGEFIYIATSDDTMSPIFLEKMLAALLQHPECNLAHCCLTIIDERKTVNKIDWNFLNPALYFKDLMKISHIRQKPHDAILYSCLSSVYVSITQLLIRKKLFNEIGLFLTQYGSTADFEWCMRAAFFSDTIHVPEYLASWRLHAQQATQQNFLKTTEHKKMLIFFVKHAFKKFKNKNKNSNLKIKKRDLLFIYNYELFLLLLKEKKGKIKKALFLLSWFFKNSQIVIHFLKNKNKTTFNHKDELEFAEKLNKKYQLKNLIKIVQ